MKLRPQVNSSASPSVGTSIARGSAKTAILGNELLATDLSDTIAGWTADRFNINSNIYDSAIDAVYNETRVGGASLHHLVDGQHSLWGAFRAARDASPDDSIWEEMGGALEHLARDTCSKSGINPFFSLKPETYHRLADGLQDTLGVSRGWVADALTFNAPEVLGAGIGVIPLALGWNRLGTERFAELTTSMTLAATISANPLLGALSLVAAVKTAKTAGQEPRALLKTLRGLARGATTTGVTLAVSRAVGGPVLLGVAAGIGAGLLARHGFDRLIPEIPDSTPAT